MLATLFLLAGETPGPMETIEADPIHRSMGGAIASDIMAHLPNNSILGAVYLASAPGIASIARQCVTSAFGAILASAESDPNALVNSPLALNRLLFLRDPNPSADFLKATLEANEAGKNFEDENPAVSYELRSSMLGMTQQMAPLHRTLTAAHTGDDTKLFEALGRDFPVLVVYGSHDAYMSGDKMMELLRPRCTNLAVHVIENGSHIPFFDSPEEVIHCIMEFATRVLSK